MLDMRACMRMHDGRVINAGTWGYHPPTSTDIPIEMNVTLIPVAAKARAIRTKRRTSNHKAVGDHGENLTNSEAATSKLVLGSKASGEPAYLLGVAAFFAVKQCVYAAREEVEGEAQAYFRLDAPATPERVHEVCLVDADEMAATSFAA